MNLLRGGQLYWQAADATDYSDSPERTLLFAESSDVMMLIRPEETVRPDMLADGRTVSDILALNEPDTVALAKRESGRDSTAAHFDMPSSGHCGDALETPQFDVSRNRKEREHISALVLDTAIVRFAIPPAESDGAASMDSYATSDERDVVDAMKALEASLVGNVHVPPKRVAVAVPPAESDGAASMDSCATRDDGDVVAAMKAIEASLVGKSVHL